jgi:hypothetical protein
VPAEARQCIHPASRGGKWPGGVAEAARSIDGDGEFYEEAEAGTAELEASRQERGISALLVVGLPGG